VAIGVPAAVIGLCVIGAIVGGSSRRSSLTASNSKDNGNKFGLIRQIEAHNGHVRALAFSPDGKFLLSGGEDRVIRLWDVASGDRLKEFKAHEGNVNALKFFSDGNRFLSASDDRTIRVWRTASPKPISQFDGHTAEVLCIALSSDGGKLVSGGKDKTVRLWDVDNRRQLASVPLPDSTFIESIALSPDAHFALCSPGFWHVTR